MAAGSNEDDTWTSIAVATQSSPGIPAVWPCGQAQYLPVGLGIPGKRRRCTAPKLGFMIFLSCLNCH